eukprot:COSAG06_NODE_1177_length_10397_cov_13.052821_3_plen_224_part_00
MLSDFDTPRAFNDYLEEVELLIYSRVHETGGQCTCPPTGLHTCGLKVSWGGRSYTWEEHKRENDEEIRTNRRRRDEEKRKWERKAAEEEERREALIASWAEEEAGKKRDKDAEQTRHLNDLINDRKGGGDSKLRSPTTGSPGEKENERARPRAQPTAAAPRVVPRIIERLDPPASKKARWPEAETARRRRYARARDQSEAKAGLFFVGKAPYGQVTQLAATES